MKSLADVLGAALKRTGSPGALKTIWARAVGDIIARHSTPARWEGSTLVIRVEPAWKPALEAELPQLSRKLAEAMGESTPVPLVLEAS
jgi:hypothetical protein